MKGVIFNLLEEFIVENWDEETYEEILDECTFITQEPFVGPGTYPDEDLVTLVTKAVEKLEVPAPAALRAFGKWLSPKLAVLVPDSMTAFEHPKDFLKTVDRIIHVEVRKLYGDAEPPQFVYRDPAPDRLVIEYQSKRKMYDLMDGLIEGVAEYYQSPIQYTRETRQQDGTEICEYELTFSSAE